MVSELKPVALMHKHDDVPTEFESYNHGAGCLTIHDKDAGWTETPLYCTEALEAAFRLGLEAAAGVANAAKGNWADCARRFPDTTTIAASAEAAEVIADAILAIDPAQHIKESGRC